MSNDAKSDKLTVPDTERRAYPVGLWQSLVTAVCAMLLALFGASLQPELRASQSNPSSAAQSTATSTPSLTPTRLLPTPTLTAVSAAAISPSLTPESVPPTVTSPPQIKPTPTSTPRKVDSLEIGQSVLGRPILAQRVGAGPIKVVLIGDIHGGYESNTYTLTKQLLTHFVDQPAEIPENVSLWFIPSMNPDGLATGHRWNANDVDLNRNADTDMDGCAGNDWSPDTVGYEGAHPGAGGRHPFSEPEARAVRDFLQDAWIAVFYHSAAEAIFLDSCQHHAPTAKLAQVLSKGTGYPVPEEGWTGYPITGDFGDYLAGEGVAAVTVELTDHTNSEFKRNLAGVHALLDSVGEIVGAEAQQQNASHVWLQVGKHGNLGQWKYPANSFIHPIAIHVIGRTAYVLDGGQVLALALDKPTVPEVVLAPGHAVDGTRVLEPLDLAGDYSSLLVLDRAGDVYRFTPSDNSWTLEHYDRPVRDIYDHYFVALSSHNQDRYLLETTHEEIVRYTHSDSVARWAQVPKGRDVDISASTLGAYVLTRSMNSPRASLLFFKDGQRIDDFQPALEIMQPRQVESTDTSLYVLDRDGRRLLALAPETGALQLAYSFPDRRPVSAIWADPNGEQIILCGRNTLYFLDQPQREAAVQGDPSLGGPQAHDPQVLGRLPALSMPIEGASLTSRDFQMPGAPRHYRLGIHEGIDFYGHTVGAAIDNQTTVHAIADGVVIRALIGYDGLSARQADAWNAESHQLGYTPDDVLDGYRGRQIWIDHGDGLISRYAHLSSIAPGIKEGTQVTQGQTIATVGNSGTPASVNSDTYDVHLHMELWIASDSASTEGVGHYIGQFMRPIETRAWLERILR